MEDKRGINYAATYFSILLSYLNLAPPPPPHSFYPASFFSFLFASPSFVLTHSPLFPRNETKVSLHLTNLAQAREKINV
jgi:hypothetical protein